MCVVLNMWPRLHLRHQDGDGEGKGYDLDGGGRHNARYDDHHDPRLPSN